MKNIRIFAAAKAIGVWCSWLAFLHGVQAVARSSRATPTKEQLSNRLLFLCGFGAKTAQKKGRPKTSFSIVISKPSILPKALLEVEHFVLDALRFVESVNIESVRVDVTVINVLFLDDIAVEDTFL